MLNKRDRKFLEIMKRVETGTYDEDEDFTFILDQISVMVKGYV